MAVHSCMLQLIGLQLSLRLHLTNQPRQDLDVPVSMCCQSCVPLCCCSLISYRGPELALWDCCLQSFCLPHEMNAVPKMLISNEPTNVIEGANMNGCRQLQTCVKMLGIEVSFAGLAACFMIGFSIYLNVSFVAQPTKLPSMQLCTGITETPGKCLKPSKQTKLDRLMRSITTETGPPPCGPHLAPCTLILDGPATIAMNRMALPSCRPVHSPCGRAIKD